MELKWIFKTFTELTAAELYAVLQLRNEVFVVEQNCVYQDADGKDQPSWHLMGWHGDELVVYTRIIPPGISFTEASIGRVVSSPKFRRAGMGIALMEESIERCNKLFNHGPIKIGAQLYLTKFYQSFGFVQSSDEYLEDGIPHIDMILNK